MCVHPRCVCSRTTNSFPLSAAYMRQWIGSALVQIMAWRYCQLDHGNKLQWNSHQNTKLFNYENTSQNIVCEMAAIVSRKRWVRNICFETRKAKPPLKHRWLFSSPKQVWDMINYAFNSMFIWSLIDFDKTIVKVGIVVILKCTLQFPICLLLGCALFCCGYIISH